MFEIRIHKNFFDSANCSVSDTKVMNGMQMKKPESMGCTALPQTKKEGA